MKLGVVMDPVSGINIKKDTTFAMMLAAQQRGWEIHYMEQNDLFIDEQRARAHTRTISFKEDSTDWYRFHETCTIVLSDLDVILMRKDPPFDIEYIYTTYILEYAKHDGVLVVNDPAALRDVNEKMFINRFPQCIAPTLVSRNHIQLRTFIEQHGEVVLKPLEGMGGKSVFRLHHGDPNTSVVMETLTHEQTRYIMAQKYIPAISEGDKRILMIDGVPIDYALARVPLAGETRGNLAAGGTGKGVELSDRDRWICEQVAPVLVEKGLTFVGLDVIGDYLTEINVTSPTCVRELDRIYGIDIGGELMDVIGKKVYSAR